MSWLQCGARLRLGGTEHRSYVGRCALIIACTIAVCAAASQYHTASAEPSYSRHLARELFGPEQRADEIYLDAVEKLDAGHPDFASELFESVIEQYPTSAAAAHARRELAALGRGSSAPALIVTAPRALPAAPPSTTGSISPVALADTQSAASTTVQRTPIWDVELRRNASIQSKLRIEAGDRVFFSPGSAELGSRARVALAAQAQWLIRWREFETAIEGHADEPGSDQENVALSVQRAEAVRQRLIDEGVEPRRIAVVPLGRSVPLATCSDVDCRSQNCRVVTRVFATGTQARLGLVGGSPRAATLVPQVSARFAQQPGDQTPPPARQVGVTR